MRAISHSLTGVIATSLVVSTNPIYLITASFVSLLPDIDTSTSTLGRVYPFKWIARWIEQRFPHRSITHSFLITGIITLATSPLILFNPLLWQTICLSYFIGWFGDVFTKSGVCAFYPSQARLIIPGNPRLRLSTNSPAERWVICLLCFILSFSLYINNYGSIVNLFNSFLGFPSGAMEQMRSSISDHLIIVRVEGHNSFTKEKIDDDFEVVELLSNTDFVGKRNQTFYRIGSSVSVNIGVSKMRIVSQEPINQTTQQITIDDDYLLDYLDFEDNGRTYITGNLFTEDGEYLMLPIRADIYNSISLQGSGNLILVSAPLSEVREYLDDIFVTGTIIVRQIN